MRFKRPRLFNFGSLQSSVAANSNPISSRNISGNIKESPNEGMTGGGRCSQGNKIQDVGNSPYAFNIEHASEANQNFRTTVWTGRNLQLTLMSIPVGEDIGTEIHDDIDQFIGIQSGVGEVCMGRLKNNMNYKQALNSDYAILIPAGTFHNIKNTGKSPLKLYSVYAPRKHPFGTVDKTKDDAEMRESEGDEMA